MVLHEKSAPSELPTLLEELRLANFHLSNLVRMAAAKACDESETLLAAALNYANEEFSIYERIFALSSTAPLESVRSK